jgi:hypothetical protein
MFLDRLWPTQGLDINDKLLPAQPLSATMPGLQAAGKQDIRHKKPTLKVDASGLYRETPRARSCFYPAIMI